MLSFWVCPTFPMVPHNVSSIEKDGIPLRENVMVLEKIYLLKDDGSEWEITEIVKNKNDAKWVESTYGQKISLGSSDATWWFRLQLKGKALPSTAHYLTIDFSLLEEVELYVPNNDGSFNIQRAGIAMKEEPPGWRTRIASFRLTALSKDPVIYLKVASQSPILVPLSLKTEKEYFSSELINYLFFGIFFGIIMLVICYNLILSILTKESIYLHYLIYVFFLAILLLHYYGFGYQYLWSDGGMWIDKVMPGSILFVALTMINFVRRFLDTKKNFPVIDRFFRFYLAAYLILILVAFFIPTSLLFLLLAPTSSILMIILATILIRSLKKKFTPASYVLIGWIFLFGGAISLVAKTFGLIPHTSFTSFAILFGAVVEVIMFSVAIGYRFKWLKKEAARMTQELEQKYVEIESLREKVAKDIMDSSPKSFQLSLTISKADINSYLLNELTERELEVLYRVAEGLANKEIGEQLFISTNTVRAHMRKIYDKLHVKNRTEAVFKANQLNLI